MPVYPPVVSALQSIQHFVVLMFENRSFDHLLGYERGFNPDIDGIAGTLTNAADPADAASAVASVVRATEFGMPFDPPHEFDDVATQIYAPNANGTVATMGGFVAASIHAGNDFPAASRVMEGFQADQIPVFTALTRQFGVCNYWHSSLPGPTWPNRFFIHAATSGGLTDSPSTAQILAGFNFPGSTLYERLEAAKLNWRIYHDGLPQAAGVDYLRTHYISPFTKRFRDMDDFLNDARAGDLPEYTFIEPCYDTGHHYLDGNSMHPRNDIRKGEALLKSVYETIRNSPAWPATMLIVTFDEHGGFYDHVTPPLGAPTGDDQRYRNPNAGFGFDRLGVRVPNLIISAYTQPGSVIGQPNVFDHTSVLKTVEDRFGLAPLTARDASAASLAVGLNLAIARTDAPTTLPDPLTDVAAAALKTGPVSLAVPADAPLSDNQQSLVDLALKCNLDLARPEFQDQLLAEHAAVQSQGDAADYLTQHEAVIAAQRR